MKPAVQLTIFDTTFKVGSQPGSDSYTLIRGCKLSEHKFGDLKQARVHYSAIYTWVGHRAVLVSRASPSYAKARFLRGRGWRARLEHAVGIIPYGRMGSACSA